MSDEIEDAVMAENNAKIQAGRALKAAIIAESEAQEALKVAMQKSAAARRDAFKVGWNEKSLKQLGLVTLRRKKNQPKQDSDQQVPLKEA